MLACVVSNSEKGFDIEVSFTYHIASIPYGTGTSKWNWNIEKMFDLKLIENKTVIVSNWLLKYEHKKIKNSAEKRVINQDKRN